MKLNEIKNINEARGETVTVEYEWENPKSKDYESHMIDIVCNVVTTTDPFGTGDSPTEYDVDFVSATFRETGKPFNVKWIPEKTWNWIEDAAIQQAKRG